MTSEELAAFRRRYIMPEVPVSNVTRPPDATAPDEMDVARQRYGAPPEPDPPQQQQQAQGSWGAVLRDAAIRGLTGVGDVAQMALNPMGGMSDAIRQRIMRDAQPQTLSGLVTGERPAPPPLPGTMDAARAGLRERGWYDTPDAVPTTPGQRIVAGTVEGAMAGVPFGPMGMVAGGAGGALGESAAEGARALDANQYVQGGARLAGNLVGGAFAPSAVSGLSRLSARTSTPGPVLQAYERLNIAPRLPAAVSDSPALASATGASGSFPGGGRIEQQTRLMVDDLADAVDNAARAMASAPRAGGARATPANPALMTPQGAGEVVQAGVRNWIDRSLAQEDMLYNDLWSRLSGRGITSPLTNARSMLDDTASALRREAPEVAAHLSDNYLVNLARELRATGALSPEAVREFRTKIGAALGAAQRSGTGDAAELNRLYAALSDDIREVAARAGAAVEFNRANGFAAQRRELIDQLRPNLLERRGREVPPEAAYAWTTGQMRAGDTRLGQVGQALLPEEMGYLGGTVLRQAAQPAARVPGAAAGGPRVSAQNLVTGLNDLSPEARTMLFSGMTNRAGANPVEDLSRVAGGMTNAERFVNRSRTANAAGWGAIGTGGAGGALGLSSGTMTPGAAAVPAGGAAGAPVLNALAARTLLANQWASRVAGRQGVRTLPAAVGSGLGAAAGFLNPQQRRMLGLP